MLKAVSVTMVLTWGKVHTQGLLTVDVRIDRTFLPIIDQSKKE